MAPKKTPKKFVFKSVKNANFWRKYVIILPRKNLPIWDPNLPLRNPKSPYLALRKYHMYGRTLEKFFAKYDSDTNTGNASLYGLQKFDLKYGLSIHIKNKGRFKSQLYMQNTIYSKSQTLKYFFFARSGDVNRKGGVSTYNLR